MEIWREMEKAQADKRQLSAAAGLRTAAEGRRVIAVTTSGASKQRCALKGATYRQQRLSDVAEHRRGVQGNRGRVYQQA